MPVCADWGWLPGLAVRELAGGCAVVAVRLARVRRGARGGRGAARAGFPLTGSGRCLPILGSRGRAVPYLGRPPLIGANSFVLLLLVCDLGSDIALSGGQHAGGAVCARE